MQTTQKHSNKHETNPPTKHHKQKQKRQAPTLSNHL